MLIILCILPLVYAHYNVYNKNMEKENKHFLEGNTMNTGLAKMKDFTAKQNTETLLQSYKLLGASKREKAEYRMMYAVIVDELVQRGILVFDDETFECKLVGE